MRAGVAGLCMLLLASKFAWADGVAVDGGWLTVRDLNLEIKAGSPLDFSPFFAGSPAARRVEADRDGNLTVGGRKERFLCAPMILTPPYGGFPEPAQADRYARQLKRAGYNLVRLTHIETTLMTGRQRDFDFDPIQLDRFEYFISALKREGLYVQLDLMASDNAAYGGVKPHRWIDMHRMKARVHVDPLAQAHWRSMVEALFGKVNRYTGTSLLNDESVFGVVLVNEGLLQFLTHVGKSVPPDLVPALADWLAKRYPSPAAFEKVWGQPHANLANGRLVVPNVRARSPQMDDVLAFYDELQAGTARWMEAHLRSLGYRGLVTAYNNLATSHAARSRAAFKWVDFHSYHDEAFGFAPGARIENDSSFDRDLSYVTSFAMSRLAGRAFTASEYGHPFWNQWRREAALVMPSYAAFHDWGSICQHASTAVDLTYVQPTGWKKSIIPYAVGLDPVGRAVETLAALLYRRGDVKTGSSVVEIELPGGAGEASARYWGAPRDLARIGLVSRTRVVFGETAPANLGSNVLGRFAVQPESKVGKKLSELAQRSRLFDGGVSKYADAVSSQQRLHSRTSGAGGRFENETGELLAEMRERRFSVKTERTQGVVFENVEAPIGLGTLRVLSSDRPGLVALSSLDQKPLAASRRMLLLVVSDALNTGMRFAAPDRKELRELGTLPARIQPLRVDLEFSGAGRYRLHALNAVGDVTDEIPVSNLGNSATSTIDLAALRSGPTFYYLVERE